MQLYEIVGYMSGLEQWLNAIEESGSGNATQEEVDTAKDTLESLEYDLADKVEGIVKAIKNHQAAAEALKKESDLFAQRSTAEQNKAKRSKEFLHQMMLTAGKDKVQTDLFKVSIVKNGGKNPIKVMVPAEELPVRFRVTEYKPNMDEIREFLEEGNTSDSFQLEERGTHLSIR